MIVVLLETFVTNQLLFWLPMSNLKDISTSIAQVFFQINPFLISSSLSLLPKERRGMKMDNWVRFWWTKRYSYYIRTAARHLLLEGFSPFCHIRDNVHNSLCSKWLSKNYNELVRYCKTRHQAIKTNGGEGCNSRGVHKCDIYSEFSMLFFMHMY